MSFTLALTQHNSTDAAVLGSDDQIQLVYSLDYGKTWVEIQTWDNTSSISNTGDYFSIYKDGYSNSPLLLIAFWVSSGSVNDAEDVDFFIDDVSAMHHGTGSVDDLKAKGFSFSPNPANNTLNLTAKEPINTIILFDVFGRKIQQSKIDAYQKQIDISNLTKGLYYLQVQIENTVGMVKVLKR
ncbi:MAG TPA: T9SS type A sorting domain-containing protein [Lutibacter sp.]|nr:T9SS type A sorting domain-containing protein [Lutibacter sp.]